MIEYHTQNANIRNKFRGSNDHIVLNYDFVIKFKFCDLSLSSVIAAQIRDLSVGHIYVYDLI